MTTLIKMGECLSAMDPRWIYVLFVLIGLVIGLLMRQRETKLVSNLVCGVVGAVLFGVLVMLALPDFYGNVGALLLSFAGSVIFMSIKRVFTADIQK